MGEWVDFPTTKKTIQDVFSRIGIDGIRYEEWFCSDYETTVDGLHDCLSEYMNLDELNYLASQISNLKPYELEHFEAAIALGNYTNSLADLINLVQNVDIVYFYSDIDSQYDLGYYWVEESGCYDIATLGSLSNYIDYEAFGLDIALETGGIFLSNGGYAEPTGDDLTEFYDGKVPEEHKIAFHPSPAKKERSVLKKDMER